MHYLTLQLMPEITHSHLFLYILPYHITIKLLNWPTKSYTLMYSPIIVEVLTFFELLKQNFSSFQEISSEFTEACVKEDRSFLYMLNINFVRFWPISIYYIFKSQHLTMKYNLIWWRLISNLVWTHYWYLGARNIT